MKDQIQILIADDHPVFRRGLAMMIATDGKLKVIAEASDGAQALNLIQELQPDIAVLDVNMPEMTGFDVARELQKLNLATNVIFLTMHKDEGMFNTALDLNAKGYLLKESAVEDIVTGIKAVAKGENFISPQLTSFLFNRSRRNFSSNEKTLTINDLTPAEHRVLKLISEEKTSREIAEMLFISVRTVERHRENICTKLDIHGSNALLKFALAHKEKF
ncbi:MAG: response regulator transcription factor [Acidobacteriota bacterium]